MRTIICPTKIFALCKNPDTRPEGRRQAIEWMKSTIDQIAIGDKIIAPCPETGEPMEWEKTERKLQA